ncbi:MAG: phage terminase small subunit P27 family [Phycisphaerales bacterium]|nr:phage terminase small subunit P27 family [Phycisphaerales bacterium]
MKSTEKITIPIKLGKYAKAEWDRVICILCERGEFDAELDRAALTNYCMAWGSLLEAERMLSKGEMTATTKNGTDIPSVWLGIRNTALKQVREHARELGFTPLARKETRGRKKKEKGMVDILDGLDDSDVLKFPRHA